MTFDERRLQNEKIRNNAYYVLIAVVSIVSVVFLPMLTSDIHTAFNIPKTFAGICVWVITKLCIAGVNIAIFYAFTQQAIVNIKDDLRFIEANKKLQQLKHWSQYKAMAPETFKRKQWITKGITLLITSLASTFVITEAILSFSLIQFLSYLFTIFFGVVFGYLTMRGNEEYWVSEFPLYVDDLEEEILKQRQEEQAIAGSTNDAQNCQNFEVSEEIKEIVLEEENVENLTDLEVNDNA